MAFWPKCLYFETYILEFKIGFDHGLQLVNDVSVFNGILAHFLSIFDLFFGVFCCSFVFLAILWDNQANFLPILSNLQVNHIELIIIYQAFLFPQNIQNAN